MLKGLGFFAEFQLKMLSLSCTSAPDTSSQNADPSVVIKKHLTEKINEELKRNTMIVYKSYRMSQAASIGSKFTVDDFEHMDFR